MAKEIPFLIKLIDELLIAISKKDSFKYEKESLLTARLILQKEFASKSLDDF